MIDEQRIFAIERPDPSLMKLYLIRSILSGPFIVLSLPMLYFRYHTMRYRFDEEGISMRWGILFRREVNLTYARIQDIHLTSGVLQRWLGLADIHIQTASGSARAEMTIEGLREFEDMRNFLYAKMRGMKGGGKGAPAVASPAAAGIPADGEAVALIQEIAQEVRAAREALDRIMEQGGAS